ncbi:unnamed protein product [Adineta ricciae]|uniref:Uncharacterized protein n=1 Tax=Adineta ricciae TaxID=249248 RepID=A0A815KI86_ADIRI|nr:unnamed protein product [Adineta ricciae]
MKKTLVLLLLITYVLYSLAEKLNNEKKNVKSTDESLHRIKSMKYPADIIESVQTDLPGEPRIKINFAGMDEGDDDDDDATISIDTDDEDEDEDEDEDVIPMKKTNLPKSKPEDIHSFL